MTVREQRVHELLDMAINVNGYTFDDMNYYQIATDMAGCSQEMEGKVDEILPFVRSYFEK